MAIEVDGLAKRRIFFPALEERWLYRQTSTVALAHGLEDCVRVDPLVHVQGGGRDFKRAVLLLACPHQLRIEMRIVIQIPGGVLPKARG